MPNYKTSILNDKANKSGERKVERRVVGVMSGAHRALYAS